MSSQWGSLYFVLAFPPDSGVFVTYRGSLVDQVAETVARRQAKTAWFMVTHRKKENSPAYIELGKFTAFLSRSSRQIEVGPEPLYAVDVASH